LSKITNEDLEPGCRLSVHEWVVEQASVDRHEAAGSINRSHVVRPSRDIDAAGPDNRLYLVEVIENPAIQPVEWQPRAK